MDVKRDFYIKFYKVLHGKFLEKEHIPAVVERYKGTLSPDVWLGHDNLTDQPKVTSYFAGRSGKCGIKYFYYRYLDFTSPKKKPWPESCEIEDLTLIKTLIYIGIGEGLKLKIIDYTGSEKVITLNFNNLRNSNEWITIDSEETRDILVNLFRKEYMSANVTVDKPVTSSTKPLGMSILEILENLEFLDFEDRKFSDEQLSGEGKNILYDYIFNFAKPLPHRMFALATLMNNPLLNATEIINLFNIPDKKIRSSSLLQMNKLGANLSDVHRYDVIQQSAEVVFTDLNLLIEFSCGALHLHLLYALKFLSDIITSLNPKPKGVGVPVLRNINLAFYTLSDITFTNSCFRNSTYPIQWLIKESPPEKMLQAIIIECHLAGATTKQLNDFKFILIRNHPELYSVMKSTISSLLGKDEEEYDKSKKLHVPGVQINKLFQLPVDPYFPFN